MNPTHLSLFEILFANHQVTLCTAKPTVSFLCKTICEQRNINYDEADDNFKTLLETKVKAFATRLKAKWQKANRTEQRFRQDEAQWLASCFTVPVPTVSQPPVQKRGRPSKPFNELSVRQQTNRTRALRESHSTEELCSAASSSLYTEGKRAAADIVQQASQKSPERPLKLQRILREAGSNACQPFTPNEALALVIDSRLTVRAYKGIRKAAMAKKAPIYPSYAKVKKAKEDCYPDGITITKRGASVPLQNLLDHTCLRLLQTVEFPDEKLLAGCDFFLLQLKFGCDGSSGYPEYMRRDTQVQPGESAESDAGSSDGEGHEEVSEKYVFLFSVVPLQLTCNEIDDGQKVLLWRNNRPSSTSFCRPLKILYVKENKATTREEVCKIEEEIRNLHSLKTAVNGTTQVEIKYDLKMTMLDVKTVSTLTNTADQNCYLCGSKPGTMNDIDRALSTPLRTENLRFGASPLHGRLQGGLNYCLHLAYKLGLKRYTIRGATLDEKAEIEERTKNVKAALKDKLGLIVDRVVQGKGTSNTGNVSRIFFENPVEAAEATGLDKTLIERLGVIFQVLNGNRRINEDAYHTYAVETARRAVALYPWYWMPPTLHKILLHGSAIIENADLPVGMLSEEAQESTNKIIRRFRRDNARFTSQSATTTDVFNRILAASDPVITSMRSFTRAKSKNLHDDAKKLVVESEEEQETDDSEDDSLIEKED